MTSLNISNNTIFDDVASAHTSLHPCFVYDYEAFYKVAKKEWVKNLTIRQALLNKQELRG